MPAHRPTNIPYVTHRPDDDVNVGLVGGQVLQYTAGGTLNVGDCVLLSAATTVNKSVTKANYTSFIGVVVGGKQTDGRALTSSAEVGLLAANINETVLVQISGQAYVVADSAVAIGINVSAGATAGRVDDATLATATDFALVFGIAITAAVNPADKIVMLIRPK